MDRKLRLTMSVLIGVLVFGPFALLFCAGGRPRGEPITAGQYVTAAFVTAVVTALMYMALSFLDLMASAPVIPLTDEQTLLRNIRAGRRIQRMQNLPALPTGYKALEDLYRKEYGREPL